MPDYEARKVGLQHVVEHECDRDSIAEVLEASPYSGEDAAVQPERYVLVSMAGDDGDKRITIGDWKMVCACAEEEVLYGYNVVAIFDLDTADEDGHVQEVAYDVRVHVTLPNAQPIDHLRRMHEYLFPERYGSPDYEEGECYQWHAGTIEDIASMLNRALADDDCAQLLTGERNEARAQNARVQS